MVLPPTGWVTALAGLLARGSGPEVQPSQFPSGWRGQQARRLQLRGQPRPQSTDRSRVPSCLPGSHRGTSTAASILLWLVPVKGAPHGSPRPVAMAQQPIDVHGR